MADLQVVYREETYIEPLEVVEEVLQTSLRGAGDETVRQLAARYFDLPTTLDDYVVTRPGGNIIVAPKAVAG